MEGFKITPEEEARFALMEKLAGRPADQASGFFEDVADFSLLVMRYNLGISLFVFPDHKMMRDYNRRFEKAARRLEEPDRFGDLLGNEWVMWPDGHRTPFRGLIAESDKPVLAAVIDANPEAEAQELADIYFRETGSGQEVNS